MVRRHLLLSFINRYQDDLNRGEFRRQHQAVVIRVSHDERSHQTGRNTPGSGPYVFEFALLVDVLYVECLGEVLAQEVRRAALEGLAVLHQRFDREGIDRTGEPFVRRFVTDDYRYAHPLLDEFLVNVDHPGSLLDGLLLRGMGRVALLPEKFRRAQEQAGTHLPAYDVRPLVAEDRQVAVGLDPALVSVPDDRFRGGTDDQLLFEFGIGIDHDALALGIVFQAVVGDHGALLGKAFHVVGLFREERLGDEEREIGVLVPRVLKHLVQGRLHFLPDGIAVRLDYHAAAYGRIFG